MAGHGVNFSRFFSNKSLRFRAGVPAALLLVMVVACGAERAPSTPAILQVSWQMSASMCSASGVEQVSVQLINDTKQLTRAVPCARGAALLEDIAPGHYELVLAGTDAQKVTTFASRRIPLEVAPGDFKRVDALALRAKPPVLTVRWEVPGARDCADDTVRVEVFDAAGQRAATQDFACEKGLGVLTTLSDGGDYSVVVTARPGAAPAFTARARARLERGAEKSLRVVLTPDG